MLRWLTSAAITLGILSAQQIRDAAAYPVRAEIGAVTLAADYLVHSIPAEGGMLLAEDYLVVEAAFFGTPGRAWKVTVDRFTLRLNGKKAALLAQTPAWVAASIKDPAWYGQKGNLTVGGGIGNAGVVLGRPVPVERFPGDPTARRPLPAGTVQMQKADGVPIEDQIARAALPEGDRKLPVSGLLFFPYKGKMKSVKAVELLYEGPAGVVVLKLQ